LHNWVITGPYNLVLDYKDHELKKDDIGGDNYLLAITTAPVLQKIVDHIQITFQNRALTLDEALVEAKKLNDWFVAAGFHPLSLSDPDPGKIVEPFHIESQERSAARYNSAITSYRQAHTAFLDPNARIIEMIPFVLETDDAGVGLHVVNARRQRENVGADKDESSTVTERTYFLNLSMSARPADRYWNK